MRYSHIVSLAIAVLAAPAAHAQTPDSPVSAIPAPSPYSYADLADLALPARVVAHVGLRRAVALRPADAPGVAQGFTRFYVEADVRALIRGEAGTPPTVSYLIDLPNDSRGRPVRPARRSEWLIFAQPVAGQPSQLTLAAPDAQLPFTAESGERVRAILREALDADAAPAITGIGRAFHVPGALPGAGETQLFLQTADNQPISITVRREAGAEPEWFVSLTEFVAAGATRPERDTLLWYRLACVLPAALPAASLVDAGEHRQQIVTDYALVRSGLGNCTRTRGR